MSKTTPLGKLIKTADLSNIKHLVVFRNETSGTKVIEENEIELVELKENGVVLCVPLRSCAQKHNLSLCFVKLPISKKISFYEQAIKMKGAFEVTGKIINVDNADDKKKKNLLIDVKFNQFNSKKWGEFVISYIKRQKEINSLKKAI